MKKFLDALCDKNPDGVPDVVVVFDLGQAVLGVLRHARLPGVEDVATEGLYQMLGPGQIGDKQGMVTTYFEADKVRRVSILADFQKKPEIITPGGLHVGGRRH